MNEQNGGPTVGVDLGGTKIAEAVRFAPNLGRHDKEIRDIVQEAIGPPVAVENDANVYTPATPATANWGRVANCRGSDIRTFFPPRDDGNAIRRALALCEQCPVRMPCRRYALDHRERHGIWGGLTEETRETLLRIGPPRAVPALPQERASAP
ncbi:WhiB family transcriptional regulator [Streptomyces sp. NPDC005811]|uniref:WhiB family transcriptional regulator n=1 Tax=Streptomyces sp. NPDC005811 TaxID=3154565 RepID=UPI0033C29FFF